jgi:hypothetical protein
MIARLDTKAITDALSACEWFIRAVAEGPRSTSWRAEQTKASIALTNAREALRFLEVEVEPVQNNDSEILRTALRDLLELVERERSGFKCDYEYWKVNIEQAKNALECKS